MSVGLIARRCRWVKPWYHRHRRAMSSGPGEKPPQGLALPDRAAPPKGGAELSPSGSNVPTSPGRAVSDTPQRLVVRSRESNESAALGASDTAVAQATS